MACAEDWAAPYDDSDSWQSAQCLDRIGAMSRVKVGTAPMLSGENTNMAIAETGIAGLRGIVNSGQGRRGKPRRPGRVN